MKVKRKGEAIISGRKKMQKEKRSYTNWTSDEERQVYAECYSTKGKPECKDAVVVW